MDQSLVSKVSNIIKERSKEFDFTITDKMNEDIEKCLHSFSNEAYYKKDVVLMIDLMSNMYDTFIDIGMTKGTAAFLTLSFTEE